MGVLAIFAPKVLRITLRDLQPEVWVPKAFAGKPFNIFETGGTTGMPKGVMYKMGPMAQGFITGGLPLVGLAPPASIEELPATAGSR